MRTSLQARLSAAWNTDVHTAARLLLWPVRFLELHGTARERRTTHSESTQHRGPRRLKAEPENDA
jgi:hypothetical protein